MLDEPEHPYLGDEFGRRYIDPATATNAQQAGEYIASNAAFRKRQDAQEEATRRMVTLLEEKTSMKYGDMTNKEKLEWLIGRADELINRQVDSSEPDFCMWRDRTVRFLAQHFGESSRELEAFKRFNFATYRYSTRKRYPEHDSPADEMNACVGDLKRARAVLVGYLDEIDDKLVSRQKVLLQMDKSKVFIVHGHNAELKLEVARLMEKIGVTPIILSEQPNCGSTIIEKIEKNSDVGAAICLFTADDECKDGAKRARQNVVLETGYFWGKLGRDKMVILADKGVELPSDMQGVVYTDTVNWQFSVCKELKQMGYDIDLNCLA